jgi:hypothetical protein
MDRWLWDFLGQSEGAASAQVYKPEESKITRL